MKLRFAQNLKTLRTEKGMTQDMLAENLGVSAQSVSRWETGVTYPDIELLPIIASLFGVSVDTLLDSDEAARKHRAWEVINDHDRFESKEERNKALLRVYRENRDDLLIKQWCFQFLAELENPPEIITEAKRIGYEMLGDPALPREESRGVTNHMATIVSDEELPDFIEKYTTDDTRSFALAMRYRAREDIEKANHYVQLNNFEHLRKTFERGFYKYNTVKAENNYSWSISDVEGTYVASERALNAIAALSGVCDPKHPVSGDGMVDIFLHWRRNWGVRYAVALAAKGEKEKMYTVLEDVIDLSKKIWAMPEGETVENRGGLFDCINAYLEPERGHDPDSKFHKRNALGLYDGDDELTVVFSVQPFISIDRYTEFDPYRNEERFKKIYADALELNIDKLGMRDN